MPYRLNNPLISPISHLCLSVLREGLRCCSVLGARHLSPPTPVCVGPVERMCTSVTSAGEREGGVKWMDEIKGSERERRGGRESREERSRRNEMRKYLVHGGLTKLVTVVVVLELVLPSSDLMHVGHRS